MLIKETGVKILQLIGGKENIVSAAHCATRLRLVLKDEEIVDKKKLRKFRTCKGSIF